MNIQFDIKVNGTTATTYAEELAAFGGNVADATAKANARIAELNA